MAEQLVVFTDQCKEQLAFRYLAGQNGAYPVVFSACQLASGDRNLMMKAFNTLSAILDGQPDLLDSAGQDLLLQTLKEYKEDAEMTLAGIRCIRHACLKHEQNRQDFVKGGVLPLLTGAIVLHGDSADVVRTASSALRIMTFDDDIRVPFGHAHDHAKMIVLENDGLRVLIEAAKGKIHPMTVGPNFESSLLSYPKTVLCSLKLHRDHLEIWYLRGLSPLKCAPREKYSGCSGGYWQHQGDSYRAICQFV